MAADIRHAGVLACQAREAVGQYEHAHTRDLRAVRDELSHVEAVLGEYLGASGSVMTSYRPESLASSGSVMALYSGMVALQAAQAERAPTMRDVYSREEDRAAILEAEAAAERAKWGWIKAVGAVVTIALGVIVIVASAGTATPLVVVAAAGAATVFGASDLVEAVGDIRYGSRGDASTSAFNLLRSAVRAGNQTLYDVAGFVVCAVATAGTPLTQAAKLGQLSRWTVARAVVREGVEDLAAQKIAEFATPHLGAEGALAAAVVAGGGMSRVGGGPKVPGGAGGSTSLGVDASRVLAGGGAPAAGGGGAVLSALQRQKIAMYDALIARHADKPWLVQMFDGSRFDWERAHAYTFNEVAVTRPGGGPALRVDSFTPGDAVVSRKTTQLADAGVARGKSYVDELLMKYNPRTPGIVIADTKANQVKFADRPDLIGKSLDGRLVIEVPIQKVSIPDEIRVYAKDRGVDFAEVARMD